MIEPLAELSQAELDDVARELRELQGVNDGSTRKVVRGPDLIKLLESLRARPEFADDLEAVFRENRSRSHSARISPLVSSIPSRNTGPTPLAANFRRLPRLFEAKRDLALGRVG